MHGGIYEKYKRALATRFLDIYSSTNKSIHNICKELGISYPAIYLWSRDNVDDFREQFNEARKLHAQVKIDSVEAQLEEISELDTYTDNNGKTRLDSAAILYKKLKAENARWHATKELREKYGERIETTHKIERIESWLDKIKDIDDKENTE